MHGHHWSRFDTLVQGAMVALFHSMGAALAPVAPTSRRSTDVELMAPVGAIQFRLPGGGGAFYLTVPWDLCIRDLPGGEWEGDRLRELLNQFMGRMKIRLLQFQVKAAYDLPILLTQEEVDHRTTEAQRFRVYTFRSLRGNVQLVLDGSVDAVSLVYSCRVDVPGDDEIAPLSGGEARDQPR